MSRQTTIVNKVLNKVNRKKYIHLEQQDEKIGETKDILTDDCVSICF